MNLETSELVSALGTIHEHLPRLIRELLADELSVAKQHQFASLLIELGELLHQHADLPSSIIVSGRDGGRSVSSGPRHALQKPAVPPEGSGGVLS
jgi:hypothetical protein